MTIVQKKIKLLRKWQWEISRILYIFMNFSWTFHEFFMNFLWIFQEQFFMNFSWIFHERFMNFSWTFHEFFMNFFQNYLEKLGLSIFPKLPWNVSKTTWKFRPPQYFQVVLEIFPGSFGNVSCIENALGTVGGHPPLMVCLWRQPL
jgi:hypothetical protein